MMDQEMSETGVTLWDIIYAGYSLRALETVNPSDPINTGSDYEMGLAQHCENLLEFIDSLQLISEPRGAP